MKTFVRRGLYVTAALLLAYSVMLAALNAGLGRWLLEGAANRALFASAGAFRCQRVVVTPTLRIRLYGVSAQVPLNRQRINYSVARFSLDRSLLACWRARRLTMRVSGGAIKSHDLTVEGIEARFDGPWPGTTSATQPVGHLQIRSLRAGQLAVNQLDGAIVQEGAAYRVDPLTMQGYDGEFRGSLVAQLAPSTRVELALDASRLHLGELAAFNAEIFRGAQGQFHGTLHIAGDAQHLTVLTGSFLVDEPGGTIGARFLQGLLVYTPKTVERTRLKQAGAQGALVPFTSASLSVDLADPQHLKIVFNMAVPEYNFLLNNFVVDTPLEPLQTLSQLPEFVGTVLMSVFDVLGKLPGKE